LQQDSAKHYKLLEWISHTDYPAQQSAIIKDRQEGTGQWFLAAPEVTQWKSEVKATLFCPGIPGAGKTMMAAIAIDHLQRSVQSDFHGVAYIYCNYKAQQQQDLTSMLAAILKQLTQGQSPSLAYVERLHERHAKHGTKPSLKDIYNTLEQVCSLYQTVYIVIDALDECQDSTRRQLLTKVHDLQTRRDVRLMVTSRSMPEIESEYQTALRLEVRATKEDIKRFVAHQIHRLPMCIRRDPTLQELVQERIIEAVDGM
jgi:Cdc6-like AAA superfamily ATPase